MLRLPKSGLGFIEIASSGDKTSNKTEDEQVFDKAEVVSLQYSYPFRFLVPENSVESPCRWIYPMTFGGGLVGGDDVHFKVKIGAHTAAVVSTQESTKVYHCHSADVCETTQRVAYEVGKDSLLCVLPDPVVCYRDASFTQAQRIQMDTSSSLVFLDWMLSGRVALSEAWDFIRFRNSVEVTVEEELVLRDSSELENTNLLMVAQSMQNFNVFGTCIVLGRFVAGLSTQLLQKYGRKKDLGETVRPDLVVSVSPLEYDIRHRKLSGCFLRFLAVDTQTAAEVLRDLTRPLYSTLGADPFDKKL